MLVTLNPEVVKVRETGTTNCFELVLMPHRVNGIGHDDKRDVCGLYNGKPRAIGVLTEVGPDLYTTSLFNRESEPGTLEHVLTLLANSVQSFR